MGRRVGTLGLYAELLGEPSGVRQMLACSGALTRWHLVEMSTPGLPAADEPLRLDPALRSWLLGQTDALDDDPLVRRATQRSPWSGADLLDAANARADAAELVGRLQDGGAHWLVLGGDSAATWRGLVELGARGFGIKPVRVDVARLASLTPPEIDECGRRLARLARLGSRPLVVDSGSLSDEATQGDDVRAALAAIGTAGLPAALIANEVPAVIRWLADAPYQIVAPPQMGDRIEGVRRAASAADASLTTESAQRIAGQYPLKIDKLELAVQLARTMPLSHDASDPRAERFETACRDVSAAGLSRLAERIEPVFDLDDVVLPGDRRQQLIEIVDNVRLTTKVLDEWKFRRQLPYGRGVAALFHGPSGTGKTMAALAVAHRLGVQILRIDLSRIVSKYIGDTEKNIDRVFLDARMSGAALLIDEADALLGKRSEVKDAHDRYANIEVAYLLQRMEAHEGLAILTTNLRQNLDHAFVRRLRFIVDFPRPDAHAREQIWRRCLPDESHVLDDAAFRQLGRRMDLTGGHIRQITLRAAFLAAAAGVPITLEHLASASRAEFAKLGMPPVEIEVAEHRRAA
jgi:ATPase family associated with various cellular activities (AAA)